MPAPPPDAGAAAPACLRRRTRCRCRCTRVPAPPNPMPVPLHPRAGAAEPDAAATAPGRWGPLHGGLRRGSKGLSVAPLRVLGMDGIDLLTAPGPASDAQSAARPVRAALSPSRAADFLQCPLLYRFRVVDRLAEAPSAAAVRGTMVHAVLERLFDLPAPQRTLAAARSMLGPQWERLLAEQPELAALFPENGPEQGPQDEAADGAQDGGTPLADWLASADALVECWFSLEDPTRLEPA